MKHLLYASFAVCIALFSGCSDQEVVGPDAGQEEQPGVKVSMSLQGDMGGQSGSPKAEGPSRRAIGYQTIATDGHAEGFPTPIGIFDQSGDDGKELEDGTKVPVVLIFRNSDDSQPITKVVTNWTYKKGGKLSLNTNESFELKAGSKLNVGTWYVCGILGSLMAIQKAIRLAHQPARSQRGAQTFRTFSVGASWKPMRRMVPLRQSCRFASSSLARSFA